MLIADAWAQKQFGEAQLGDRRRVRRVVKVAGALARLAESPMAQAFRDWAGRKAFYRLMGSSHVTYEHLIQPHLDRTRAHCRLEPEVVLVGDTTDLDFTTHGAAEGLGYIGDGGGKGICVHSTLALAIRGWDEDKTEPQVRALGLFDQEVWTRPGEPRKGREPKRERLLRPRESDHWGRRLGQIAGPQEGVQWTYVADREADIYEMFAGRVPSGIEVIIRASHPRRVNACPGQTVFAAAAAGRVLGSSAVELRSRPGQPSRTARLKVRAVHVELHPPWRPDRKLLPAGVWVLEASEQNPPAGVKGLKWVLLSNRPIRDLKQARRVLALYAMRWFVEEYHKALKSGTRIEKSQLSTAPKLMALLGILAVVAVRLIDAKLMGRSASQEKVETELCPDELRRVLEIGTGSEIQDWTHRAFIRALAKLGGFLGRKGDGEPGWQTIWRGWMIAQERLNGYLSAIADLKSG